MLGEIREKGLRVRLGCRVGVGEVGKGSVMKGLGKEFGFYSKYNGIKQHFMEGSAITWSMFRS